MKKRTTAIAFALLLGGLGAHKFYLDKPLQGILYIVFCWTLIPAGIGLTEALIYATMSNDEFDKEYNQQSQPAEQITYNALDNLSKLAELKEKGVISEEEFNLQKQKILN